MAAGGNEKARKVGRGKGMEEISLLFFFVLAIQTGGGGGERGFLQGMLGRKKDGGVVKHQMESGEGGEKATRS